MIEAPSNFRQALIVAIPNLRAYALYLANNPHTADDLVQETLLKAWAGQSGFAEGTNQKAWLFTILRNCYFSQCRKRRREIQDSNGDAANSLVAPPEQLGQLELADFKAALAKLPADQREALILVGAEGLSYEEVAAICGCAIGTVKSRVNRARAKMADMLSMSSPQDVGEPAMNLTVTSRR